MPKALHCVLMLNTEVVVMELRLMFCSEDTGSDREKGWVPFLSLSVQSVISDGEPGQNWRLIEEQLHTLSSLITEPVSRCSGPHSGSLDHLLSDAHAEGNALVLSITISIVLLLSLLQLCRGNQHYYTTAHIKYLSYVFVFPFCVVYKLNGRKKSVLQEILVGRFCSAVCSHILCFIFFKAEIKVSYVTIGNERTK